MLHRMPLVLSRRGHTVSLVSMGVDCIAGKTVGGAMRAFGPIHRLKGRVLKVEMVGEINRLTAVKTVAYEP